MTTFFNILLIEDEAEDARQIEEQLRKSQLRPFHLQRAASLGDGIKILKDSTEINVVLLDLFLPDSHGMKTFFELHKLFPQIPIIVLTGLMDINMGLQAVENGAQNFLEKTHLNEHLLDSSIRFAIARHKKTATLEQAISSAKIATFEYDPGSSHMKWSSAIHKMLGTDEAETVLSHLNEFMVWVNEEDQSKVDHALTEAIQAGYSSAQYIRLRHKDNQPVFASFRAEAEFDPFREQQVVVGLLQDMTDMQRMKSLIQEKELADRTAKLRQDFLARTSHEIRTPLNPILVLTKLLLASPVSDQQKEYLEAINSAGKTLLAVVNDILDLSKIEAGKIEFIEEPFSIPRAMQQIEDMMSSSAAEKGLSFLMDIDESLSQMILGDSVRLSQILLNLLSNGIKFTEKGHVGMYARQESRQGNTVKVRFTVFDSGIGIPASNLRSIFDSFNQAENSHDKRQLGTGLGLTIVKRLVQLQGGDVEVESEVNVGSKFSFTLEYKLAYTEEEAKQLSGVSSELNGKKILLAEDNPLNQLVTKKLLTDWGVELDIASHGKEAIEKLQRETYDLILMDIQMPVMDGLEATRVIRKHFPAHKAKIPIIAMTANAISGADNECTRAGMTDYVSKPIEITTLYHKLVRYSAKQPEQEKPTGQEGTIESDAPVTIVPSFEPMAKITHIDLSYLREVSNGDASIMKMAIEKYLETTPGYLENLHIQLRGLNYDGLRKAAHKLKSSLQFMGLNDLYHLALMVETSCKAEQNMEQLPIWVGQITEGISDSYPLLQSELESL